MVVSGNNGGNDEIQKPEYRAAMQNMHQKLSHTLGITDGLMELFKLYIITLHNHNLPCQPQESRRSTPLHNAVSQESAEYILLN